MRARQKRATLGWLAAVAFLCLLLCAPSIVDAERLPLRVYTTADGLVRDNINRIVRDSRGFLWFCTAEGLSRFDGYSFTNYTTAHGLSHPVVRGLLETRSGVYWVATGNGVSRFNPKGRLGSVVRGSSSETRPETRSATGDRAKQSQFGKRTTGDPFFVAISSSDNQKTGTVNVLLEDRAGVVWAGAGRGLYRLEQANGEWALQFIEIGLPREVENDMIVRALAEDRHGALWIGAGSGLYRRWPDGRTERYTTEHGLPMNEVRALLVDADGQLWVGTRDGLCQMVLAPNTHQPRVVKTYTTVSGLPSANTRSLFQSSNGRLWIGFTSALVEFVPKAESDGSGARRYIGEVVLRKVFVQTMVEDGEGNLWIGTDNSAFKLARNGFTTYTEDDGLGGSRIHSLFESRRGDLCVMTLVSETPLNWFDGKRFKAIRPKVPNRFDYFGWGWHQLTLQDRAGEWWLPTGQGLVRYPKVNHVGHLATTPPKAIYTMKDGLVSNDVFRLYEDSRGDIWIVTFAEARCGLTRWERATETFHQYSETDGLALRSLIPHAFAEDRAGNLWIGFEVDALARYRDGRFTVFTPQDGLPAGFVQGLHCDQKGRLWIATTVGGLGRIDDPSAERPRFTTYTIAQGLSSNFIGGITEDQWGRIYAGTGRGVDRLDPETGHIKPYGSNDGLVSDAIRVALRDRHGALWFGASKGLSRFLPEPDRVQSPPPIYISGLRVAGRTFPLSQVGETDVSLAELGPNQNQLQIDFIGLGYGSGEVLRYQYKLEGSDPDWSAPSDQRAVNYASLAPGVYRFLVRAINADGTPSASPATISFRVLAPMWQRWWFLALVASMIAAVAVVIHRVRVERLLELERVRMRIATDLHDDIGASLSQMAILTEVIKQQQAVTHPDGIQMLTQVAETSRHLVDTMSDIVWAIDPRRDELSHLIIRIGRFAAAVLGPKGISWDFETPPDEETIKLTPDQRRHVYLILKEAITNIARHSQARSAWLAIRVVDHNLEAKVRDDGCGLDGRGPNDEIRPAGGGHGLENMRARAKELDGQLQVESAPAEGVRVILTVPLK